MAKSIKCTLRIHEWEKFMGLNNLGNSKFSQKYKCKNCGKIKEVIK